MCFSTIVFKDGKPNRQAELLACTSSINWTCRAKQFSRGSSKNRSLDLDWSNSSKREQKIYRVRMLLCACRFTNRLLGICVEWQEVQITALTFASFVSVCFLLLWWPGVADVFYYCKESLSPYIYSPQLLFAYFAKLFRDEQNKQMDVEVEGGSNNGVDSIPCAGGLVVKRTQVRRCWYEWSGLISLLAFIFFCHIVTCKGCI